MTTDPEDSAPFMEFTDIGRSWKKIAKKRKSVNDYSALEESIKENNKGTIYKKFK